MKKVILLFLVAMLMAWPVALAQETGNMTTYVVTDDECVADEDCDADEVCDEGECEDIEEDEEETDDEEGDDVVLIIEGSGNETDDEEGDDVVLIIEGSGNETDDEEGDEEEPAVEIPEEVVTEAGITPDSPLYGLERAIERLSLALTFGKAAKAKKGLAHARERLMEVQAMIAAKKMGAAATAQAEYNDIVGDVEDQVADLGNGDVGDELADELEIEGELAAQGAIVDQISGMLVRAKGLTAEQEAQLGAIAASMEGTTTRAKLTVQVKKNKTKIKIKATQGLSDEQLESLEAQVVAAMGEGSRVKIVGRKAQGAKNKDLGGDDEDDDSDDVDGNETEDSDDDADDDELEGNGKGKSKDKKDKGSDDEE